MDPRSLDPPATLSIDPGATVSALRTGAALAALFLVATTVAATRGLQVIAVTLLIAAAAQGLYGLLILASGHDYIWTIRKEHYLGSATGTFVNRNHFAGFLAMALSCGAGLFLKALDRRDRGSRLKWLSAEGSRGLLVALLLAVGLAGLIASFSRAGIALGMTAVAVVLLTGRARGERGRFRARLAVTSLVVAVAVVPLAQLGSDRLIERYARSADDFVAQGSRARVWLDTMSIVAAHPVVGSGLGTFATVYPAYRSPDVRLYYAHAHNDLLQLAAETGFVGLMALVLILAPLMTHMVGALAGRAGMLGLGVAMGLVVAFLHALIDFNFHIPANAATATVLAGAIEGLAWRHES